MICPSCRVENRPQARFCKRCGGWLLPGCPFCHATLPEASIYCDQCGAALKSSAPEHGLPPPTPSPQNPKTPLPDLPPHPPQPTPQPQDPKTPDRWLDNQLHTLEAAELIHEVARLPETEYIFRHSLTQEATYAAILLRRRREFHRRVGEAIETLYPERLEEFYSVLAHHFHQADDPRSFHYDLLAGDAAFRTSAIAESLMHYARAANVAPLFDAPADQIVHPYLRCGRCKELQGDYAGAVEFYTRLEALANQRNDAAMLLAALQAQATAYAIPTRAQDPARARQLVTQVLALADQSGDQAAQAKILWTDLVLHLYSGSAQEGIPAGEQAVILARQLGLHELLAHVLQDLSMVYMGVGRVHAAVLAVIEAGSLWEEVGNLAMLAENRAHSAFFHVISGDLMSALRLAEEASQIATRIDNRWGQVNAYAFVALAHVALGDHDAVWNITKFGIEAGDEVGHPGYILNRIWRSMLYENLGDADHAFSLAEEADRVGAHFRPFRPLSLAHLARQHAARGRLEEAVRLRGECMLHGGTQTLFIIDVWISLLDAELLLLRGDGRTAFQQIARLIAWLREIGARFFLPEALYLCAAILRSLDEPERAAASLQEGIVAARTMGMRCPTWQMLEDLAQLQRERGDADSQMLTVESRTLQDWIASHTTLAEIREKSGGRMRRILDKK